MTQRKPLHQKLKCEERESNGRSKVGKAHNRYV